MTRQLRARLSVLSLSIKKVCLRQYHFSMEEMRKGFLFCQRGWTLGAFEREGKGSYPNSGVNKQLDVIDCFFSIYGEQQGKTHLFL